MRRRTARIGAGLVAAAVVATACGSTSSGGSTSGRNDSSASPRVELATGFHALRDASVVTLAFGLDTTTANLITISGEGGDTPLTAKQAGLLTGARLTIETAAPSGKTLATADGHGTTFSFVGSSEGTDFFGMREVGGTLYAQVDLKDLYAVIGQPKGYQYLLRQTASLPSFVEALLAGQWVAIPLSTVSALEGAVAGATGAQVPDTGQIAGLAGKLDADLLSDLTINRTSTGTVDQFTLSGNLRTLAKTFVSDVITAIPAAASQLKGADARQVPSKSLTATAAVTNGAVSKLEFDIGQFSPGQKDTLPIAATFATSGPAITAPQGAVTVDSSQLFRMLAQFGSSS